MSIGEQGSGVTSEEEYLECHVNGCGNSCVHDVGNET